MPATFNLSLGAVNPGPPTTWRGTIIKPAEVTAAVLRKSLLESLVLDGFLFFILFIFGFTSWLTLIRITLHIARFYNLNFQLAVIYSFPVFYERDLDQKPNYHKLWNFP